MSVRIFSDVEEALSREVRRITFHKARTLDKTVLQDTFDPFTGEIVQAPIEPNFYDSSADANHIQYPSFFVRLLKTREDRFTGRVVPEYGKWIVAPLKNSPGAYEIVVSSADALINPIGNTLTTSIFQIKKIQPGHLIRLLNGNNKGTYIVDSIVVNSNGDHEVIVSNTLLQNLPAILFDSTSRVVQFQEGVDLSTIKIGDIFVDFASNSFNITAIDVNAGNITINGSTDPDLSEDSTITRLGDVFTVTDLSNVRYLVMDPTKPITTSTSCGEVNQTTSSAGFSPEVPIDAWYLIRIDSKERADHIDVLNRVWEEFNPPRTGLAVIKRTSLSAEQELTSDIPTGGSNTVEVKDNSNFKVGDKVYIFDDLRPSKRQDGEGFERPFESVVTGKSSTDEIILQDTVPDIYLKANTAKIVSNAEFRLLMFNFVDHGTKDVEGSQYWVHEFTFWVQLWVDRLEQPKDLGTITEIDSLITDIDTEVEDS